MVSGQEGVEQGLVGLRQGCFVQQIRTPLPGPAQGLHPAPAGDVGVVAGQQDLGHRAQGVLDREALSAADRALLDEFLEENPL